MHLNMTKQLRLSVNEECVIELILPSSNPPLNFFPILETRKRL